MLASISKGILLGAANVFVVALGLGAIELAYDRHPTGELTRLVIQLGLVPGLVTGAALGALADRLAGARAAILTLLALAAVVALGLALAPMLIPYACAPTALLAIALDRWTRRAVEPPPVSVRCTSALKGAALGAYAVVAIAALVGTIVLLEPPSRGWPGDGEAAGWGFGSYVSGHDVAVQIGMIIAFVGAVPGIVSGMCLGWLADQMLEWPPWARSIVLAITAATGVALLGTLTRQGLFIAPACVPALAAAIVLERWTRGDFVSLPRARRIRPRARR